MQSSDTSFSVFTSFSVLINALGGKLLQNVGGAAMFTESYPVGIAAGKLNGFGHQQSFAAAVVSGRLGSLTAIGAAAIAQATGNGPSDDEESRAAYGFLQAARQGDTGGADLDAALLGLAIWHEQARDPINLTRLLFDLVNQDAASAFSRLPSYQGLNAWDMAVSLEDVVEGW